MKKIRLSSVPIGLPIDETAQVLDYPEWVYGTATPDDRYYLTIYDGLLVGINFFIDITSPAPSKRWRIAISYPDENGFYYEGDRRCVVDRRFQRRREAETWLKTAMQELEPVLVIGALTPQ